MIVINFMEYVMRYIYLFCFSFVLMNNESSVLVLKSYTDISPEYLDSNDINTINSLFLDGLNEYFVHIESSEVSCFDDECALLELSNTSNDEVVYTRLQKLGTKIIFSASILDSSNSFDSKATAMSIEDMEKVCLRLSKSIALRQTLEEAADIDNNTEEDEEEASRRKSLGRVGLTAGYFFPFDKLVYEDHEFFDPDDPEIKEYSNLFKFSWNYYNEFNNNTGLLFEIGAAPPVVTFIDLNFLKFENKLDTSPYYGGGLGFYTIKKNNDWSEMSISDSYDGGMCLNLQAGVVLYRTYDLNVILRGKLVQIFNEDMDRGVMFDVGVQWKVKSRSRRDTGYTRVVNRYPILDIILDRD